MRNIFFILTLLLGVSAVAAQDLPDNLCDGLHYIVEQTVLAKPSTFTGYVIEGETSIAGKKAMQVWTMNVDTSEKGRICAYLYAEGTKVYQLGYKGTEFEDTWFLIYDFGLQPGEEMEGYVFLTDTPSKYNYKCLKVEEDPKYNGLRVMTLSAAYSEYPSHWTVDGENPQWIIGVGSTRGLLIPTDAFMVNDSTTYLVEVSEGDDVLFSSFDHSSLEETMCDTCESKEVYDLYGRKVVATSNDFQPGVYILREDGVSRKIMIK